MADSDKKRFQKLVKDRRKAKAERKSDSALAVNGVPKNRQLFGEVTRFIAKKWKPLGIIFLIYLASYILFVNSRFDISDMRDNAHAIDKFLGVETPAFNFNIELTGTALSNATTMDSASTLYSGILFMINSLALIWLMRHYWAGRKTTVRQAYYRGMYPLIPLFLILVIASLYLLPFSIGSYVLGVVISNSLAVTIIEKVAVSALFLATFILSSYLIISPVMGFYIVTIPEMTPLKALKSASEMLKGRRWLVLSKIMLVGISLLAIGFLIVFSTVLVLPQIALFVPGLMMVIGILLAHIYIYAFYRKLIDG